MAAFFAYGTLMHPALLRSVCGLAPPPEPAELPGFARFRVHDAVYPAVVAEPGARTAGVLYRGLDAAALGRLDRFEGPLYRRRRLPVRDQAGRLVETFVYVVAPGREGDLSGEPWDADHFEAHHLSRYLRAASGERS